MPYLHQAQHQDVWTVLDGKLEKLLDGCVVAGLAQIQQSF